jgi:hypothetical protein
MTADPYSSLTTRLADVHADLVAHPLYATLGERAALVRFMESHVFAVWDFMSLLKTLQARLTTTTVPWTPPQQRLAARLINEIVLGEETDEVEPGCFMSHFELYLEAMTEVGANTSSVTRFVDALVAGVPVDEALARAEPTPHAARFVRHTLQHTQAPTIAVASSFLLGRERLVPAMFETIISGLGTTACPRLRLYLERHVHVDGQDHGPKAEALLRALCGTSSSSWKAAEGAAREALVARQALWDGVLASVR